MQPPLNTSIPVTPGGDVIPDPLTLAGSPYTVTYDCQDVTGNAADQLTRTINVFPAGTVLINLIGPTPVNHELP